MKYPRLQTHVGPKCAGSPISWSMCCRLNVILIVKFCSDELSEKRHLLFWGYSLIYVFMIDLDKEACEKIKVSSIVDSTVKTNFYWNGFGIGTKYFQSEITLSTCFEKINWVFSEAKGRKRIIKIWKSNLPNGLNRFADITLIWNAKWNVPCVSISVKQHWQSHKMFQQRYLFLSILYFQYSFESFTDIEWRWKK